MLDDHQALARWRASAERPLVFTNGCFDILHRGHVAYLERAAALGATLLVAVNSDASVRRLEKGRLKMSMERPVNPLADRMAVLAALGAVDAVTAFDDDSPLALIKLTRPDHLVKGGDWAVANIVGGGEVKAWGGEVHAIPFEFQRSTSDLIERIQSG
ncbi:MAG: adenylyltransferase/cytidyltransferase family protein [Pseudomonadota bacterium]|nr:adenylyltransferase/cytidyltransferase family protein [Pseudomonadota bacterium]